MANRAFLLAHDSAVPIPATADEAAILAAADYGLPSLWLALFSVGSLSSVEVEFHDDSGKRRLEAVTTLMTSTAAAVGRFDHRVGGLLGYCSCDDFCTPGSALLAEISIMFATADEFLADLKDSLVAADVVRFWLRGYQWVAPVPWTD